MLLKTSLLFFFACAFVLVAGRSVTPDNQQDELQIRAKRSLGEFFTNVLDKTVEVFDGVYDKANGTINKIRGNIGDGIEASIDIAQAALDVATAGPQVALNILHGKNITEAFKDPYETVQGSLSKTRDSIRGAVSGAFGVGISSIQTAWDLSTILPHIGIKVVKDTKLYKQMETALKKTYEQEKKSINQAIESVQNAGNKLKDISFEVGKITFDVALKIPEIAVEYLKNPENKKTAEKIEEIRQNIKNSYDLIQEASSQINTAGKDVLQASLDLSIVVPNYGLNLLSEEDQEDLIESIKKKVADIKASTLKAVQEVNEAAIKIKDATLQSTKAGADIGFMLPSLGLNLYNQEKLDAVEAVKKTLKETKESVNSALDEIQNAGEKIFTAGTDVVNASIKLGNSVPEIGLSYLSKLRGKLDDDKINEIEKVRDEFFDFLNGLTNKGEEMKQIGQEVINNSN